VTDIALQEGEQLVGSGPVAAGDTVRWIIGDTVSGIGPAARVHILVKPTRPDLATNLVINTDRRTYHLELRATPSTYMASLSWTIRRSAHHLRRATGGHGCRASQPDRRDRAQLLP
jgi:type IV secretion system protein VirB9